MLLVVGKTTLKDKCQSQTKYVCVISLHVIYISLGTDDIVQSLKEQKSNDRGLG